MKAIYEIVDYTNNEMYYPLGVFATLEDARQAISESEKEDRPISPWQDEEYERIVIVERKIGWSENGKRVEEINRQEYYDEENDEYKWRRV